MAEPSAQERTESATPRRREKAREEGQLVRSREVVSTGLFLGNLIFFAVAGATVCQQMVQLTRHTLNTLERVDVTLAGVYTLFLDDLRQMGLMLFPLFLFLCIVAVLTNVLQTGMVFAQKALEPKLSHLNPITGLKRLFSLRSIHELLKSLIKVSIVGYIAYASINNNIDYIFPLSLQPLESIIDFIGKNIFRLGIYVSYALVAISIVDYGFQRWQYEKDLRMSPDEIKEERKESEGDPLLRTRIRSIMREMARKRMMAEVPTADVVVTNPTHIAVALRYRRQEMSAPKVVAKGAGHIAERIKQVAQQHGVPLVENKAVARSLFQTVEIGAVIPEAMYKAVAEILAYVYRIKPSTAV